VRTEIATTTAGTAEIETGAEEKTKVVTGRGGVAEAEAETDN
jgi:hypothetical protein